MTFANTGTPIAILLVLALCAAGGGLLLWESARRRTRLASFASARLIPGLTASVSGLRRGIKATLVILGLSAVVLSLARPQWGFDWEENKGRGIDIMIALDVSRSMLAEDVLPNRLERAQLSIRDFVERIKGDRVGLVAFAGRAFLQCPLTLDYSAFNQTLDALDTETVPTQGTDIAAAINEAAAAFADEDNLRTIVIITDGEDLEAKGVQRAREAADENVRIFTVGVGTESGARIPIYSENGAKDYVRDEAGNVVETKLEEETLERVAAATGGFFVRLGSTGKGLDYVYTSGLESVPRAEREGRRIRVPHEQFQWFLAAGFVLLFIEAMIGTRKRNNTSVARSGSTGSRGGKGGGLTAAVVIGCGLLAVPTDAFAEPLKAQKLQREGKLNAAGNLYRDAIAANPDDPVLTYNLGTVLLETGNLREARRNFERTVEIGNLQQQGPAYYNLGNAEYDIGMEHFRAQDFEKTLERWEAAVSAFESALNLNADNRNARHNRDLVKDRIDRLREWLENQQQEQQQSGEDGEQSESEDSEQSESEQNQQSGQQRQDESSEQNQSGADQQQQQSGESGEQDQSQQEQGQQGDQQEGQQSQQNQQQQQQQSGQDGEQSEEDQQRQQGTSGEQDDSDDQSEAGQEEQQQGDQTGEDEDRQRSESGEDADGDEDSSGQAQPTAGEQAENGEDGEQVPVRLQMMTVEEATELLESLERIEQRLPATLERSTRKDNNKGKDW